MKLFCSLLIFKLRNIKKILRDSLDNFSKLKFFSDVILSYQNMCSLFFFYFKVVQ